MIPIQRYKKLPTVQDAIEYALRSWNENETLKIRFTGTGCYILDEKKLAQLIYENVRAVEAAHFEEAKYKTRSPSYPGLLRNLFKGMF
jgi:hypothetical protein